METRRITLDRIDDVIDDDNLTSANIPEDIFRMEQADREYFARRYLTRFPLTFHMAQLFELIITNPAPIITTTDDFVLLTNTLSLFTNILSDKARINIDDSFAKVNLLVRQQSPLTFDVVKKAAFLVYQFYQLYLADAGIGQHIEEHRVAISKIETIQELSACTYEIGNTVKRLNGVNSEAALQPQLQAQSYPLPQKAESVFRNDLILLGVCLGAGVAMIVILSVISAGAVPAALSIGAAIGIAVSMYVGSSLLGGFVARLLTGLKGNNKPSAANGETDNYQASRNPGTPASILSRLLKYVKSPEVYEPPRGPGRNAYERLLKQSVPDDWNSEEELARACMESDAWQERKDPRIIKNL